MSANVDLTSLRSLAQSFTAILFPANQRNRRRRAAENTNVESLEIRQLLAADFQILHDVNNTPRSSSPQHFVKVGATTFFEANDSELWKTDGTEAGTVLVKAFPEATSRDWLGDMIDGNGTLYFAAKEPIGGAAIWKSDGTEAGTQIVKSMPFEAASEIPEALSFQNNTLYFGTRMELGFVQLWKSDGTPQGTARVSSSNPASAGYRTLDSQSVLYKDVVYFTVKGPSYTNYTGTLQKVNDRVSSSIIKSGLSQPQNLTVKNGLLYFMTKDTAAGVGLWKSDGTSNGTVQVKQFTGVDFSGLTEVTDFTQVNSTLYFTLRFYDGRIELWKTNNSSNGTVKVKDIDSDPRYLQLTNSNGTLYFSTITRLGVGQIWKSDGTDAGTVPAPHPSQGEHPILPTELTDVNGTILFSAYTVAEGTELWTLNANGEPGLLKDLNPGIYEQGSSNPSQLTIMNGELYFVASDSVHGPQLWKTNGLPGGTVRLTSIADGGIDTTVIAASGGRVYFKTKRGDQLWSSDGTIEGTHFVKRFSVPANATGTGFGPQKLLNVDGTLFFFATDISSSRWQLWKSDGTEAGTFIVRDTAASIQGVEAYIAPVIVNGVIYFSAYDGTHGIELWKSDGSAEGTVMVMDVLPGTYGSQPNQLTNVAGMLYFFSHDSQYRQTLWKSDGTLNGTVIANQTVDSYGENPLGLLDHNGMLFYTAFNSDGQVSLWTSDGTRPVKPDQDYSLFYNSQMLSAGEFVYFIANSADDGLELWRTDGTDAGTKIVKDIRPGAGSSTPQLIANFDGVLYFSADDGVGGRELWKTDGTDAGTIMAFDFTGDEASSDPAAVAMIADRMIVAADNAANGRELFVQDLNNAPIDLTLSAASIAENSAPDVVVGTFDTVDPDTNNTHIYSLVDGEGDTDNVSFTINGNMLQTAASFNFEVKNNFTIRVRTTDQGNRFTEHVFAVNVTNVNEAPTSVRLTSQAESLGDSIRTSLPVKIADILVDDDALGTNTLSLSGTDAASLTLVGTQLFLKPGTVLNRKTKPTLSYTISVDDTAVGGTSDALVSSQLNISGSIPTIDAPGRTTSLQRPLITWSPIGGAATYDVWIRNVSTKVSAYLVATSRTASYLPTKDLGIGTFLVWVRAVGPQGETAAWSSPYSFQVMTPVKFKSVNTEQTTSTPSLSWTSLAGAVKYDLWIDNLSTRQSQTVRVSDLRSATWKATQDLPMGSYRAWVRAIDTAGTSAGWSVPQDFKVLPIVTQIGPTTSTFNLTPEFSWMPVLGATGYAITVRDATTDGVVISQTVTSGTKFTSTSSLTPGLYRWSVHAIGATNLRCPVATTAEFFAGGRPVVLSPRTMTSEHMPQFSWSAVEGASNYELYVSRLDVLQGGIIKANGITTTKYTSTIVLPVGTFRIWVRAISGTGVVSAWSNFRDFKIV